MSIASYLAGLLNSSGLVPVSKLNATGTPTSSNFLRGDGTWNTPVGLAYNQQVFTASGTWNKPSSGTYVQVEIWGSGAGGGGSTFGFATRLGGAGGGYSCTTFLLSDILTSTVSVTINGGGAGNGSAGTAGGNVTFGTYLTHIGGGIGGSIPIGCSTYTYAGRSGYLSSVSGITLIAGAFEASVLGNGNAIGFEGSASGNITSYRIVNGNVFAPGNGGNGNYSTSGGTSTFGGAGGNAAVTGVAGSYPGGGGGGGNSGSGGAGANGKVVVTVF